ncbi:uncharacterized protein LOC133720538 [Rosa rugosa]|uniref:uncharacterized protein LOC133720538 n=1 Tax=Rosa rugosa TaxID=74645 RepID=UPI002B40E6E8|nr:uncharacterized protein LOC133720538 [Rosa rugosa]XP_062002874.1 uncharacterized protein LOC133720538 [Rosa rugosa]
MESFGGLGFSEVNSAARRKRSNTSRRPRNESQLPLDYRDISSLSSTPPSDDNMIKSEGGGYVESDEASNNGSFRGSNEHRHTGIDSKRSSMGVLGPANRKGPSKDGSFGIVSDNLENKSTVKKVKLKVGGVTRTIQAKSTSGGASNVGLSSTKSSHISDAPRPRKRLILQENSDDNGSFGSDKGSGLRGVASKDPSKSVFDLGKDDSSRGRMPEEPIRKSKRIPKRRVLDGTVDVGDDDDDVEVRYLEKLKTSKNTPDYSLDYQEDEERAVRKERKISRVLKGSGVGQYSVDMVDYGISRSGKEGKKSRSGGVLDDTDYVEEDEPVSDGEPELKIRKKSRKEFVESSSDNKEMTVTTRRRALQTSKDVSSSIGASVIEFPNGLPPAPPRKQKDEFCAVEQQLKKVEAAQRRRMQVEKAARESEAEAIRKILGQDSSRKKKEDKIKKRQEDLAQERAANSMLPSDSVRWVMGPSGSIVTFPDTIGLPTIFDPKPCSYPPPREKCAGPYCTNPYKYRDSQSKLPLCSLQCYKAVHENMPSLSAC